MLLDKLSDLGNGSTVAAHAEPCMLCGQTRPRTGGSISNRNRSSDHDGTLIARRQVRVVKIAGGGIHDSSVVRGMVLKRDAEGTVKRVTNGKVAVFAQGIDTAGTETKANLLHVQPQDEAHSTPRMVSAWLKSCMFPHMISE